jgi:hypothetical protein
MNLSQKESDRLESRDFSSRWKHLSKKKNKNPSKTINTERNVPSKGRKHVVVVEKKGFSIQ